MALMTEGAANKGNAYSDLDDIQMIAVRSPVQGKVSVFVRGADGKLPIVDQLLCLANESIHAALVKALVNLHDRVGRRAELTHT